MAKHVNSPEEIRKAFEKFIERCDSFSPKDKYIVNEAFKLAETANEALFRDNGQPMISHSLAVAEILVDEMGLTAASVAALFLHESRKKDEKERRNLGNIFPKDISDVADGLDKISDIDMKTTSLQVEKFRKLIVSLSADPRVILIKLADRLEIMRSLAFFSPSRQLKKANETLLLYAPLSHQLGLYGIKSEMEDTALRYIEPEIYRSIKAKLKTSDVERNKFIADFVKPIETELVAQGMKFEIKSRTKSVYSIWRKMKSQQVPFEGVYDLFAIRIILDSDSENEKSDCWKVYSIVTDIYRPDTRRLRDWISMPRSTGYESLHITVDTDKGRTVEVQIRSKRMDEIAESGIAAHWRYKGVKQLESVQTWLDKVKKMLNSPSDDMEKNPSLSELKHDEIFVFTPAGDLRQLPNGASVLDFAFDIHTGIGAKCVGARVNGKNISIKEKLKTGDIVEILTSKNQSPKSDWLNYVVTSKARARIKQRIREEETKLAGMGKEMLERRLKNWKLALTDEILTALIKHFKLKVITDLYAGIASGKIDLTDTKDIIQKAENKATESQIAESTPKSETKPTKEPKSDVLEIDEKLNNIAFKLAKCCNPIFGDEIFGFVTIKEGIKIHRVSCPNANRLLERYDYRIIKARWRKIESVQSFQASLRIAGNDEPGMLGRINDMIMKVTGISVRSINIANTKGLFEARLQVYLHDKKQLDMLTVHLQQIKGVEKVVRLL
ncbi:MAG: RelA/SpoT family protein [Prevotellaceae bacterium]|jgi:GTP pyrophosphokinase|nr:RelA/SpoT family protein [Prevotellaceae bacterium]